MCKTSSPEKSRYKWFRSRLDAKTGGKTRRRTREKQKSSPSEKLSPSKKSNMDPLGQLRDTVEKLRTGCKKLEVKVESLSNVNEELARIHEAGKKVETDVTTAMTQLSDLAVSVKEVQEGHAKLTEAAETTATELGRINEAGVNVETKLEEVRTVAVANHAQVTEELAKLAAVIAAGQGTTSDQAEARDAAEKTLGSRIDKTWEAGRAVEGRVNQLHSEMETMKETQKKEFDEARLGRLRIESIGKESAQDLEAKFTQLIHSVNEIAQQHTVTQEAANKGLTAQADLGRRLTELQESFYEQQAATGAHRRTLEAVQADLSRVEARANGGQGNPFAAPGQPAASWNFAPVRLSSPPEFHGRTGESAADWLEALATYLDAAGCEEEKRVLLASTLLRGSALEWFNLRKRTEEELTSSWDTFSAELKGYFDPFDKAQSARDSLYKLHHRKGPLRDHLSQFQKLLLRVPTMAEEDKVHLFTNSLQGRVRSHVFLHDPQTLDDAMQYALQADRAAGRGGGTELSTGGGGGKAQQGDPMELGAAKGRKGSGRKDGKCNYCGKFGHWAAECKKKKYDQKKQGNGKS